jgi:hypothetical protein
LLSLVRRSILLLYDAVVDFRQQALSKAKRLSVAV